jgi:hypothetical protein
MLQACIQATALAAITSASATKSACRSPRRLLLCFAGGFTDQL